jgi:hypothetical protein
MDGYLGRLSSEGYRQVTSRRSVEVSRLVVMAVYRTGTVGQGIIRMRGEHPALSRYRPLLAKTDLSDTDATI